MTPTTTSADRPVGAPSGASPATRRVAATPEAARPSPPARLAIAFIRVYQLARTGRVSPCRFTPTCSQYAVEAVTHHGARRGLRLTAGRLLRCRPGGPSGYDPVTE